MKPTRLLIAAAFISAVILVAVGGISAAAMANRASQSAAQETIKTYQQREAEYNRLIDEANQQIEKANTNLQASQNQADQNQPVSASPTAAKTAISASAAEETAQKAAEPGQTMLKKAELISFESKPAYEIVFPKGSIYVDAQTGAVLFNGTVPQQITAEQAAKIASDYLHDPDILQVDQITFRGSQLYRVIFKSGVMAYLDTTGQITYMQKPSQTVQVSAPNQGGGGTGGGHHEDDHHDEHENGHD